MLALFQNHPILIVYIELNFMIRTITTTPLNDSYDNSIALAAIIKPFTTVWNFLL